MTAFAFETSPDPIRRDLAEAFTRAYRFRQPYRDEAGEDTQLPASETVEVAVPVPAGATAVQARLWYRLYPFATDAESTLLFEHEVAVR